MVYSAAMILFLNLVEAFYKQSVANGVTIIKPITVTEWGEVHD